MRPGGGRKHSSDGRQVLGLPGPGIGGDIQLEQRLLVAKSALPAEYP